MFLIKKNKILCCYDVLITNCLCAEVTTELDNHFFCTQLRHTYKNFKKSSLQSTVECQYKVINYLQGRFSKSLRYPGEAIELKLNSTCLPKSLGCFLNVLLLQEHIANNAVGILGKICLFSSSAFNVQ